MRIRFENIRHVVLEPHTSPWNHGVWSARTRSEKRYAVVKNCRDVFCWRLSVSIQVQDRTLETNSSARPCRTKNQGQRVEICLNLFINILFRWLHRCGTVNDILYTRYIRGNNLCIICYVTVSGPVHSNYQQRGQSKCERWKNVWRKQRFHETGEHCQHWFSPLRVSYITFFSRFSCVQKQMLRWFPRLQVATTCFSCSPPDLNSVVTNFMFCIHVK